MLVNMLASSGIDAPVRYNGFGADSQTQLLYAFVAARLCILGLSVTYLT